MKKKALAVAVLVIGALGCDPPPPPPPGEPAATVSVRPEPVVPFGPMSVRIQGTGCTPYATVPVVVFRYNGTGDAPMRNPYHWATALAGGDGAWSADVAVPVGYPGFWEVDPGCGTAPTDFTVDPPPEMALTVSPGRVTAGVRTTVEISGTGCRGTAVTWRIGWVPGAVLTGGDATVAADGSWRSTVEVTASAGRPSYPVAAFCLPAAPPLGLVGLSVQYRTGTLTIDPAS
jgi:hypothetical protein